MKRSPELQKFIDNFSKDHFGKSDTEAREEQTCVFCGNKVILENFRNAKSVKEWHISHLCQDCQDRIFGKD